MEYGLDVQYLLIVYVLGGLFLFCTLKWLTKKVDFVIVTLIKVIIHPKIKNCNFVPNPYDQGTQKEMFRRTFMLIYV